ncbi:MAG: AMP-binding protein [Phycisphaerales bacterium]
MSIHAPILRTLLAHPTRVAVVDDTRTYKGYELIVGAMHLASALAPVCKSDTLGILLPTSGAFPITALAAWMLGKTIVPLNYLLKPSELQYVVDDCGTDTIVSVGPMLEHLGEAPEVANLLKLDEVSFKGMPRPRWPRGASGSRVAALLYTSGTSGRPKGVMLTHANLLANLRQCRIGVGCGPRDTIFGVLPQFHSFGMTVLTIMPLATGARAVYAARFVPQRVVGAIREHRPTIMVAIPSMYNAMLQVKKAEPDDFTSFRMMVSGGEPLPRDVATRFQERFGVRLCEGFGLTETSPVTNICRPAEYRPGSVGPPLPDVRERIVDLATGGDLPAGEEGELRIKGPNVMKGYFNLPELTAEVFDEHGYFRTGDMAKLDADQHLYITGRIKEMLIVGGENVFPREIEEVINDHPSVHASGVVGESDPMRGEVPVAFVEAEPGATIDEQALLRHCRDRLAGYKVPRRVIVLESLPRNPTGKILRRELTAMLDSSRDAAAG